MDGTTGLGFMHSRLPTVSRPSAVSPALQMPVCYLVFTTSSKRRKSLVSVLKMRKYVRRWQAALARLMQNLMSLLRDLGGP